MSSPMIGVRYWLLDFFGEVLDFDPLRDRIYCRSLVAGGHYPGIFFFADDVEATPYDVDLRKIVSLPKPIPPLRAVSEKAGLLTFQVRDEEKPRYLRSLENGAVDFQATTINDWERFYALSEQMLHALAILGQPQLSSILDAEGALLPPLTVERKHRVAIGTVSFSLVTNTDILEEVASLPPGSEMTVELQGDDAPFCLTFKRL